MQRKPRQYFHQPYSGRLQTLPAKPERREANAPDVTSEISEDDVNTAGKKGGIHVWTILGFKN